MPHSVTTNSCLPLTLSLSLREREQQTDNSAFFKRVCEQHRAANLTRIATLSPRERAGVRGYRV